MRDYIVFEAAAPPHHPVDGAGRVAGYNPDVDNHARLMPYNCVGAVRAKNPDDAARAVVGSTRRVGKYAILEAVFIDYTVSLHDDPEGERPLLNP